MKDMKDMKDASKLATWFSLLAIVSIVTSAWFFSERLHNSGIVLLIIAFLFVLAGLCYLFKSCKSKG